MSHPRPRTSGIHPGVDGVVIRAIDAGERTCTPSSVPPFRIIRQKRERSAALLNSPAWPATPSMRRAVGSWTTPRRNGLEPAREAAAGAHGHAMSPHRTVGAMRALSDAGGREVLYFIPRRS